MQCKYDVGIIEVSVSIKRSIERSILVEVKEERGHGYDTRGLLDTHAYHTLGATVDMGIVTVGKEAGIQVPGIRDPGLARYTT